ncbi:MAG: nucleotide exchange factor GrpE, partial [Novosphingobium sp.]|nr:nucleotide exchange factor GrpE [Novosphingobium sp.]
MTDEKKRPQDDPAVAKELEGVPEEMIGQNEGATFEGIDGALAQLKEELAEAQQEVLYARAETQNVRRRLEKDIADTR